jgi:adenosylhomocysteine nucleosidase
MPHPQRENERPPRVGIVCALQAEARQLGPARQRTESLAALADGTLLHVSGMGSEAAEQGARALVEAGASALVSWGMAGGLDPALSSGTLCLPSEIIAPNGPAIQTTRLWRERLSAAVAARRPAVCGRLVTSPRAVGSVEDKAALFRKTGAVAVDMESLAVAQVALSHGLPFLAVRVIVDSAGDVLPKAVTAAADAAGHLHVWRLLGALALAPAELMALIRLARRYRAATRCLAEVAHAGWLAPGAFPLAGERPAVLS